jgi:hypothetical protein
MMDTARETPALEIPDEGERLAEAGGVPATGQVSLRTNVHDAGSGANETIDGLDATSEATRHAAEDIPTGQRPEGPVDSVPVFDRARLPPKV